MCRAIFAKVGRARLICTGDAVTPGIVDGRIPSPMRANSSGLICWVAALSSPTALLLTKSW